MSFILDALKKSEIERQRQSTPGLIDTRSRERRNRLPGWAIALAVLLGVNLLGLAYLLWHRNTAAPHAAPPTDTSPPAVADSAASAQHFSPLDSSPVYAPEIPVPAAEVPASVSRGAAAGSIPASGDPVKAAGHTGHRSDPLLSEADSPAEKQEILPSISEINLTGAQALPELHLDVHVYSTKPADRFVYVNMRKYHEGAVLQEGPTVERIRRDGVVLNYQGLRFVLPRQP
jgi:general secretion pathway protein B